MFEHNTKPTQMIEKEIEVLQYRLDTYSKKGTLTAAEKETRDQTAKVVHDLQDELMSRPVGGPLTLQDFNGGGRGGSRGGDVPIGGRDFRAMFGLAKSAQLDRGGFKDCREFLAAVDSGRFDPRLRILNSSLGESVPSAGGFAVPPDFAAEWLDSSLPNEIVRNLCRVYPMKSETKEIVGWDGTDMSNAATHGGLTMSFLAEGSTATPQTPKMRKITLAAHLAGIYVDASVELIQDGADFATNLETALRQSMGYGIDRFCIGGSGAGQPLRILNSACKIQIAEEVGQDADTLVYPNLKKMFARQLNPQAAVWLFNASSIPELLEQSIAVGTGGDFVPLLNESNGKFTIFGRPVYFHPSMPALGDEDDCAFIDWNFYGLGIRSEVAVDITDAHRWLQRERSFRVLLRFDGQCTLDQAVTPEHGDSLSPVVTLAERA